jgi:hypothetical protein
MYATLLSHSSIKVTEKHYSPWAGARQEQLESDVRLSRGALPGGAVHQADHVKSKGRVSLAGAQETSWGETVL